MSRMLRSSSGGRVDRTRTIRFTFDGRRLEGFAGDTLASALLAGGVRLAGRSFKYHRPRGLMAAGVEEPNVLVQVGSGGRMTTNLRATEVELTEGLEAKSVNRWPSLRCDLTEVNSLAARFLPAGFYYKTFFWPHWHVYEWAIRRAAGIGRPSSDPDPDRYETRHAHCDVLVVGSGPAGLAAARAAAGEGVRVILAEQDRDFGGSLLWRAGEVDGQPAEVWVSATLGALQNQPEVRLLLRTSAIGYYDHNALVMVERPPPGSRARERLWQVRAGRVVLATGALERPLVFPGNDRPGVMLAAGGHEYAARYGVAAGREVVVFANNDSAYCAAAAVEAASARIAAIVDSRRAPSAALVESWRGRCEVMAGAVVVSTRGRTALSHATVRLADGAERRIACDALLMSGGWNPTVHLFSQSGGELAYDEAIAAFRPARSVQAEESAGGANGCFDLEGALREGHAAGARAAQLAGFEPTRAAMPSTPSAPAYSLEPLWRVDGGPGKAFVDFQNDVGVDDIALAARENLISVEHLKRYTTLGMAPDQGKTSNVNALAIMGELTGRAPAQVGTTRYRPPFTPTSLAAYGGRARGEFFHPARRTPLHEVNAAAGAKFEEYGGWFRPAAYVRSGETLEAAIAREGRAVRGRAGLFDASPLGKIEVAGPDAGLFLDRIYANTVSTLKTGRARYGLMLNELGQVIDDGVLARLDQEIFVVGTTSGGADRIAAWLEEWLQCEWPELRVLVAPVTTDCGVITLTGPEARSIIGAAGCDIDLSPKAFPHMSVREGEVCGVAARVMRVSFTGEASYEIAVAADRTAEVWSALAEAGRPRGLEFVGLEAWMLLRLEKGYIHLGADTDGTTLPADIGWGHVTSRRVDFIGKRSLLWAHCGRDDRPQLVGLEVIDGGGPLQIGAHLIASQGGRPTEGYVTSSGLGPGLDRPLALAMVSGGRARIGETMRLARSARRVRIVAPGGYDVVGDRLNG